MEEEEAWDEWEDDTAVSPPQPPVSSTLHGHEAKTQAHLTTLDSPSSDAGEWGFDLCQLEQEMSNLPAAYATPFSAPDTSTSSEETLLSMLDGLPTALQAGNERMRTLEALALVARLHVIAARGSFARGSFAQLQSDAQTSREQMEKLLETTLTASESQQLEEMTGLLHHALSAENEDLTLFQEVIDQLFEGLKEQKLSESEGSETESYLNQVLAICSDEPGNTSRIPTLSEAEIFQDAKDIGRDKLLINGERVEGSRGYDAVVDALQRELELVLARQVGKTPEQTPMAVSNALHAACEQPNRVGGSSYELLGKFLSNHEMDRVLLRPASARASPLEVHMDVGPYLETVPGSKEPTWAFGLRVKLSAVTRYLVCDAEDPTNELYEIETTFCNRLAFPVGLTPFHRSTQCARTAVKLLSAWCCLQQVPKDKSK
ncbi:hypothetical protein GQ600_19879 [Phytophthora cactorum]|nr:hypothetical protein GQ600_19879 [Phytophthora cactorum]